MLSPATSRAPLLQLNLSIGRSEGLRVAGRPRTLFGMTVESTNQDSTQEEIAATAHGSAARCLARALVLAFDACDEVDIPLSQLQRVSILEAVLLEFDGFGQQLSSLATLRTLFAELSFVDQ